MKNKQKNILISVVSSILIVAIIGIGIAEIYARNDGDLTPIDSREVTGSYGLKKFRSASEFRQYIKQSQEQQYQYNNWEEGDWNMPIPQSPITGTLPAPEFDKSNDSQDGGGRYSETNTRVIGIDESDILKNNGSHLFYVSSQHGTPIPETWDIMPGGKYVPPEGKTQIISAYPVEDAELLSELERGGAIYLYEDSLISEGNGSIKSFDISDPYQPEESWEIKLEQGNEILSSKLFNDHLYLFLIRYVYEDTCPIPLLQNRSIGTKSVNCTDIYYSTPPKSSPSILSAVKVDPENGEIVDTFTHVTGGYDNVIYVSPYNIYFTYTKETNNYEIMYKFLSEKGSILPDQVRDQLELIESYEISDEAKFIEMVNIIDKHLGALSPDNQTYVRKEMGRLYLNFYNDNKDSFYSTGIIKVDSQSMRSTAEGFVQGKPPDEFALDEYNGMLRISTEIPAYTITAPFSSLFGYVEGLELVDSNDVVVLDKQLEKVGELTGLGKDENIYSTRFIGDAAYLVTFKQIDPFYVIDLSDPEEPLLMGELKIPGYSSYLHQLSQDLILGIGRDSFKVKASLFDVSDPSNPQELSSYLMPAGWSEIESNHRAFLHDELNSLFFVPTSTGGFIISYKNNNLTPVKIIDMPNVTRAAFIDNFMYIFGSDQLRIFDMNSWEQIKTIYLSSYRPGGYVD